jgi:hypothetical protein
MRSLASLELRRTQSAGGQAIKANVVGVADRKQDVMSAMRGGGMSANGSLPDWPFLSMTA